MKTEELQARDRLLVHKRTRVTVSQYDVYTQAPDGSVGMQAAFAQKKRMAVETTFYSDESKREPLFHVKDRGPDLSSHPQRQPHDVTDHEGQPVGVVRLGEGGSFFGPRIWCVEQPGLGVITGREKSGFRAFFRSFEAFSWLPTRFDFALDGQPAFTVRLKCGPGIRFAVDIADPGIDRRLVLATVLRL